MTEKHTDQFRYLTVTPKDRAWGCYVTAAGNHNVPPGRMPFSDPEGHQLWRKGRVLRDYGMIYLVNGKGVFRSREAGEISLAAGDLLLLFPNVWHRFRPDPFTGWNEQWVLFNGAQPDRLLEHEIISPRNPVFHVGRDSRVEGLFAEAMDTLWEQPSVPNRVLGALTTAILAYAVSSTPDQVEGANGSENSVVLARACIEESMHEDINMEDLARRLKLSRSTLTNQFRKATGLTPHQYHIHLRMNRAKELLEDPDLRVKQIALRLGFQDQYYFSRIFRKHTGLSPVEWRTTMRRGLGQIGK